MNDGIVFEPQTLHARLITLIGIECPRMKGYKRDCFRTTMHERLLTPIAFECCHRMKVY